VDSELAADVVTHRCQAEREVIKTKLALVRSQPEQVGELFHTLGVIGRALADVLAVTRCNPVKVCF